MQRWICAAVVGSVFAIVVQSGWAADEKPGAPSPASSATTSAEAEYFELMKTFVDTFEQIDRNYVKPVDRKELMEAAMRGMLNRLDPYSAYIDNEELGRFNQEVEQEFGGIGIQVSVDPRTRQLLVTTPLPGTPAYKAGIRAGDKIIAIDEKPTADFPTDRELESAVKLMKGKPGDSVKVSVIHEGEDKPVVLEMKRAIIKTATVLGDRYNADGTWNFRLESDPRVGYIRLAHFSRNSAEEMKDAIDKLKKDGLQALVIDLRFNPGGLLTAAVAIADMFVESGVIVSTKGRNTEEQVVRARKPGTYSGFPVVVLVNHYSASASEIVSACLQDHKKAKIVGERTWGKGSVQNVIELDGGKSALKLTTASYHRPSGKNIHRFPNAKESDEWGVMPDDGFDVKMNPEQTRKYLDYRRDRDVLRNDGQVPKSDFKDPQLEKGVAWLVEQITAKTPESKPVSDEKKTEEKKADEKKPDDAKPAEKKDEN